MNEAQGQRGMILATEVDVFLSDQVFPLEQDWLVGGLAAVGSRLETLRQEVKNRGWWAPHLPTDWGGIGLNLLEFARLSETLGQSPLGHYLFNCQAPDIGNMEILLEFGSTAQKEQFLKPLTEGRIRSCFGMTEPNHAGSNPVWMSTRAEREGDSYVINGRKWYTSGADGATFVVVMAETNPQAEKRHHRFSQIIVPTDTQGYRRLRNIPVMGERGEGYFSHSEVVFENCRVPISNLLGSEGGGFAIAQKRLGPGRIHHCMRWIGICERALSLQCHYAATRELGPGVPLGSRQAVQHALAESRAEIQAARLMVLEAAREVDAHGTSASRTSISTIKFFVAGVLHRVLDRALQTHGALGMCDDLVLAHWYRHERGARIYDGPDEVHKSVVAREMLKAYGCHVQI